jgi:hypothetical protein
VTTSRPASGSVFSEGAKVKRASISSPSGDLVAERQVANRRHDYSARRELWVTPSSGFMGRNFPGIRLVQVAHHNRSLCFFTAISFQTREPLSGMQGPARSRFLLRNVYGNDIWPGSRKIAMTITRAVTISPADIRCHTSRAIKRIQTDQLRYAAVMLMVR